MEAASLTQTAGSVAIDIYAMILDKLSKGDGYVEAEIKNDLSLKAAMQRELIDYVKLITNRFQILIFSGVNILNGKKRQRENAPATPISAATEFSDRRSEQISDEGREQITESIATNSDPTTWSIEPDPEAREEEDISWPSE